MKLFNISLFSLLIAILLTGCTMDDILPYSESEPNNDFNNANLLQANMTYDATISPLKDLDYFKFSSNSGIKIELDGDSNLELHISIYIRDDIQIYEGNTDGRGESIVIPIAAQLFSGGVYIMVESAYSDDLGSYTIKAY